eukprot:10616799-Karenia_brevis.AAC.1
MCDQISYPAVGERTATLAKVAQRGTTMIGLKDDVSKAHRRVRVRRKDRKWQLCCTRSDFIWATTVGAFGIVSAEYGWVRLGGAVERILWSLRGQSAF